MQKENNTDKQNDGPIEPSKNHWAISIDNDSDKHGFIIDCLGGRCTGELAIFNSLTGAVFSKLALEKLIDEESRHGSLRITEGSDQSLLSMSSGEQKKLLLKHILSSGPDYIILDNPYDNLDKGTQVELRALLQKLANTTICIQLMSRSNDLLPFIDKHAFLNKKTLVPKARTISYKSIDQPKHSIAIPTPLSTINYEHKTLISMKDVNVSYGDKKVLNKISWEVKRGEFWELSGNNGSGKTTILSMITGENPKGYGQDLFLFGYQKGSGESVWDIKRHIGYFTPSMTDKFTGYHSVEHMMISGILDSVGLYVKPTEAQLRIAREWLLAINMWHLRDRYFHDLTMGQKRLIMTTRAMIKHPLVLILDEPTAGLDDTSAALLVSLVNRIAKESDTSIIFVSHRTEAGLKPQFRFTLTTSGHGSTGNVTPG